MSNGYVLTPGVQLYCEAPMCSRAAAFIYGPECESTTGKLMYLCTQHAALIRDWKAKHANDPVECPTHGRIGKVKDYLVLSELPKGR